MAKKINIKFPFEETVESGVFGCNIITEEAYRDDLIALLTLKRGQRPMQGGMYSPVYDYIMEQLDDITISELKKEIEQKVDEYIPQIQIKKINLTAKPDENLLEIKIIFSIKEYYGTNQTVTINIPITEQL